MGCFSFKLHQSDNRLNIHSSDEPIMARPLAATRQESMAQIATSQYDSQSGPGPISRVRSNGRSSSASRKRNQPIIATTPARPGKEARPIGLFADVRSPRLVQASSPIKHTYHSERRGNMSLPPRQDIDRGRRRGPSGEQKANRVLGRQPGSSMPFEIKPSDESLRVRTTLNTVSKPELAKDRAHLEKRTRRANAVELPGSYHDMTEKQAVLAPSSTVSTNSSRLSSRNDSVAELPAAQIKTESELSLEPVELPAEEVTVQYVELPGSHPFVAECDAGPVPPSELPASYGFEHEKINMQFF